MNPGARITLLETTKKAYIAANKEHASHKYGTWHHPFKFLRVFFFFSVRYRYYLLMRTI